MNSCRVISFDDVTRRQLALPNPPRQRRPPNPCLSYFSGPISCATPPCAYVRSPACLRWFSSLACPLVAAVAVCCLHREQ
jgi:hypothetical protein